MNSFSQRYNMTEPEIPITIRDDAPYNLREAVLKLILHFTRFEKYVRPTYIDEWTASSHPELFDEIINEPGKDYWLCREIQEEFPLLNKDGVPYLVDQKDYFKATEEMIRNAPWYIVYDVAEYVYLDFSKENLNTARDFETNLNSILYANGIGFIMEKGKIQRREKKVFQEFQNNVLKDLAQKGKMTTHNELKEAWHALSRRPTPNITGCIKHSVAALECLARDITGYSKDTLGNIIKKDKNIFYPPLDKIAEGIWGFSSNKGRHLNEGKEPTIQEAKFIHGSSLALIDYLLEHKNALSNS